MDAGLVVVEGGGRAGGGGGGGGADEAPFWELPPREGGDGSRREPGRRVLGGDAKAP